MINIKSITQHYAKNSATVTLTTIAFLLVAIAPLLFSHAFESLEVRYHTAFKSALSALPLLPLYFCYKLDINISTRARLALLIFIAGISLLLVDIHSVYIDGTGFLDGTVTHGSQYFVDATNMEWQMNMHKFVIALDKGVLPHSYRFLPNCMLEYFLVLTNDFQFSIYIFRVIFMILMLYAIYYYSLLYCSHETALLTMLIYGTVYQISIRFYAGQITDPVSHLCFILSFIFLELDLFLYFSLAVLIGCLAKESILIMAGYYLLKSICRRNNLLKATLLLLFTLALIAGIRLYISHDIRYENISEVGLDHIWTNLNSVNPWGRQLLFTIGIFLPFLALSFKNGVRSARNLVLYLLPCLLFSNLLFSWMFETRNLVPALIPMALITANYLISIYNDNGKPLNSTES